MSQLGHDLLVTALTSRFLPVLLLWLCLALFAFLLTAVLLVQGAGLALAAGLPVGQCIDCPVQGPAVVIITNMSARPGTSPSLLLAGFALLSLIFSLAWLARQGDLHA